MSDVMLQIDGRLSARANVILTIHKVLQGQSLSYLLDDLLAVVSSDDRAFVHELLLGVLRQWWALRRISDALVVQTLDDDVVLASLNVGLYQLLCMNVPNYASIHDTVEAVKQLKKPHASGLVNAILRKVSKTPEKYAKKLAKNHSLPNWLAKQLKQDWADYYDDLGQSLRQPADVFLRVNAKFSTVSAYSSLLDEQGVAHEVVATGFDGSRAIRLCESLRIDKLPNFELGWVSVQDRHAQLSGALLAHHCQDVDVLDACAAPGGKTAHLLECSGQGRFHVKHMTALDNHPDRLKRVHQNLERLRLCDDKVAVVCDDATTFEHQDGFDVVLLDAPCTATGVIRRHPDIALLRTSDDVVQTVVLQCAILENLWRQVRDGGHLLYVTCSILKQENEQQLTAFLARHDDACAVDFELDLPNQIPQKVGYQCLPLSQADGDGFYYALLQKSAKA